MTLRKGTAGVLVFLTATTTTTHALISNQPVSKLLQEHAAQIAMLKSITTEQVGSIAEEPYSNDVFYLRYCLEYKDDNKNDAETVLKKNLDWRATTGKEICSAALKAVTLATSGGNENTSSSSWNNEPVLSGAPHSDRISKYLTPDNCLTTTTNQGDLIYCIRAGQINDVALMEQVSIEELKDFFLYAKEVNHLVTLQRSIDHDKLCAVVTANDLKGVKLVGGSADFRKALSASSKESDTLYPAAIGPTLLLNLPAILSALVRLFTPLFPQSVKARLRFEQGPLSQVDNLKQVAPGGSARQEFLNQIDALVYNK